MILKSHGQFLGGSMDISKLIKMASVLALLSISSGRLPKILNQVKIAQLKLLKESQASKWGMPMLPPTRK